MDLAIKGKVALVSGSTAGIGYAIADELAREGATVIVNGRTDDRVQQAIQKIRQSNPDAKLIGLSEDLGTANGATSTVKLHADVDILVNNLGVYEVSDFFDITDDDWLKIIELNVLSGVRLSRAYLPGMIERNWGRIVFISSESGVNIPLEMIHYGVTKTAQIALARGLAELVKGKNITVNSVLAGPTLTEGVEEFISQAAKSKGISRDEVEKEFFSVMRPSSLIQRFASSEEVAALVAYVVSERASATTGAALRVEGGVVRSIT
jgi:NAD(P)-dependent dehydrogenase (short-subunit alcohol dehydrogenase family)